MTVQERNLLGSTLTPTGPPAPKPDVTCEPGCACGDPTLCGTVDPDELCAACRHPRGRHSSGGMCAGAFDGDECYCVRFPDAPDFA